MKYFKAEIEDDNFEIILAESEMEVIEELESNGHIVLEVSEYND